MTPNHLRYSVWKHFGFDTIDGEIMDKGKTIHTQSLGDVSCIEMSLKPF